MKRIYLDYAATTPADPQVLAAMEPYFREIFGNPGSLHSFGQAASRAVFLARRTIAQAIGADYREIIFTGSATEANNMALRGAIADLRRRYAGLRVNSFSVSQRRVREGQQPRLIVSAIEHESVLETAKDLGRQGVEVIYLPVSRAGFVNLEKLKESLNERTVLVSIMYANNEIGTIQPISEIAKIIREFREQKIENKISGQKKSRSYILDSRFPLFHTDAVQALQYLDCGVNNLGVDPVRNKPPLAAAAVPRRDVGGGRISNGVDMMTLSAHKICGPKGIGILYARNVVNVGDVVVDNYNKRAPASDRTITTLQPIITGGGQEWNLRSGTENVPYIVGFAKAVELAIKIRLKEATRIKKLRDYFFKNIKRIYPQSDLNGPSLGRARLSNNLNIYFPGQEANEFLIKLDLAGIAASTGSTCSSRLHEPSHVLGAIGLDARRGGESIRFTLGRGTTKVQLDTTLKVIKNLINK